MLHHNTSDNSLTPIDLWKIIGFDPEVEKDFIIYLLSQEEYDRSLKYVEPWILQGLNPTNFPCYFHFNLRGNNIITSPIRLSSSTGKGVRRKISEITNAGRSLRIQHLDPIFEKHRGTLVSASVGIL